MTTAKDGKSFGAAALTYIAEKNLERKMGRSLDIETHTQSMAWGTFLQQRVHELLGLQYQLLADETRMHPTINYWAGTADLIVVGKMIAEIKCYQPKHFAEYTDALLTKDPEIIKRDFPQEFWQCVGNAIINQVPMVQAITYMPYKSELFDIRHMANDFDGDDQWKYRFIVEKDDSWLAYLPDGGFYSNLNKFEWEVSEQDKAALTSRVIAAGTHLKPFHIVTFNQT